MGSLEMDHFTLDTVRQSVSQLDSQPVSDQIESS